MSVRMLKLNEIENENTNGEMKYGKGVTYGY